MRDPAVPKLTDAFGNLCVAKLGTKVISSGCKVGTTRGVQEDINHTHLADADDPSQLRELMTGLAKK